MNVQRENEGGCSDLCRARCSEIEACSHKDSRDQQGVTSAPAQQTAEQEVLNRRERGLECPNKRSLFGLVFKNKQFRAAEGKGVLDSFAIEAKPNS